MHDSIIFECHYAECRFLFGVMLSVMKLSVIMLSVIKLNVVVLSVVAPVSILNILI